VISGSAKSVKDEGKVQCNCTGNQGIFVSRHVESGPVRKTNIHSQPHTEDFSGLTVENPCNPILFAGSGF
jgi:hypothetical protein